MTTFTSEQNEILKAQATEIFEKLEKGESVRDILAQIYVDNLDDKTKKQGQIMADSILESVKAFDADYQEAQEDLDRFIRKFQDKMDADKTCEERCNYWLKFGAAVSAAAAAMQEDDTDPEKIRQEIEQLEVPFEEATLEREKELRDQAMEAIKNSGILLGTIASQAKTLAEMDSADDAAGILIDLGNQELEYRAIVAMLAYTKIKNGEFENVPVEMTAAQVTTLVCAQIEQAKIMEAVGNGELAVDIASGILTILGIIVLTKIALTVGFAGIDVLIFIFSPVLVIPACLMFIAGLLRAMSKAYELWEEDSRKLVKGVSKPVRAVIDGCEMLASYVAEQILPKVVTTGKAILKKMKAVFEAVKMGRGVIVN